MFRLTLGRFFILISSLTWAALLPCHAAANSESNEYLLQYQVTLEPDNDKARVTLTIPDATLLHLLDFNLNPALHSNLSANGHLDVDNGRARWLPPDKDARLELTARISQKRDGDGYDALMTPSWAIFRGDDLIPPARVESATGAKAVATLAFTLPSDWPSVNTGWETIGEHTFRIDNPERRFDRPVGWMIAGQLGTRREQLSGTRISVSAPKGTALHRMDILTFLTMAWPEVKRAFVTLPPELLIVGGDDPMWRGGLSAPNSLFMHADRPLVSENGTSTLIHEVVHMVTGIRGTRGHDWIAEGIAEFYAVELLYRAGGFTSARRERVMAGLREWSTDVETLIKPRSTGKTTARAVVLFDQLDRELREHSGSHLDAVVQQLMARDKVSLDDLRAVCRELLGRESRTLQSPLLADT